MLVGMMPCPYDRWGFTSWGSLFSFLNFDLRCCCRWPFIVWCLSIHKWQVFPGKGMRYEQHQFPSLSPKQTSEAWFDFVRESAKTKGMVHVSRFRPISSPNHHAFMKLWIMRRSFDLRNTEAVMAEGCRATGNLVDCSCMGGWLLLV